jgi:hypothetical protein
MPVWRPLCQQIGLTGPGNAIRLIFVRFDTSRHLGLDQVIRWDWRASRLSPLITFASIHFAPDAASYSSPEVPFTPAGVNGASGYRLSLDPPVN